MPQVSHPVSAPVKERSSGFFYVFLPSFGGIAAVSYAKKRGGRKEEKEDQIPSIPAMVEHFSSFGDSVS